MSNKERIKELVKEHLEVSYLAMIKNIDRVLKSGAVDTDAWDENINPMVLPKTITAALLENESRQWIGRGTSFEKQIQKDIKNIQYFL